MLDHCPRLKGQRSRSQGHVTYPHQQRCNSAMDSRINFKLDGNDQRRWLNTWHAFYVSRPNKPEVEIWRIFAFPMKKSTKNVLKSEVEISSFLACAVKNTLYCPYLWRNRRNSRAYMRNCSVCMLGNIDNETMASIY